LEGQWFLKLPVSPTVPGVHVDLALCTSKIDVVHLRFGPDRV
jgi:hypothetical protein